MNVIKKKIQIGKSASRIKKNVNERKGGRQVSLHTRLILPLSRITRGPDDFLLYLLTLLISSHFLFRFIILITLVESVLYKVFCIKCSVAS